MLRKEETREYLHRCADHQHGGNSEDQPDGVAAVIITFLIVDRSIDQAQHDIYEQTRGHAHGIPVVTTNESH